MFQCLLMLKFGSLHKPHIMGHSVLLPLHTTVPLLRPPMGLLDRALAHHPAQCPGRCRPRNGGDAEVLRKRGGNEVSNELNGPPIICGHGLEFGSSFVQTCANLSHSSRYSLACICGCRYSKARCSKGWQKRHRTTETHLSPRDVY